jgi:RNA polymerase sigma factor (sigma-70 family)
MSMAWPARLWMSESGAATPFEKLFAAQYATVVGIARRVLGTIPEAEDVAQDVFCSFYRSYSPDAAFAVPWLHRAAAHAALNVVRGQKRRQVREASAAMDTHRIQSPNQAALDPQLQVEIAEERREVRVALGRLPEKSATVLALRYSGLSYAEVAAALGVRIGQVGTLLRRAEAALNKEMTRETPR